MPQIKIIYFGENHADPAAKLAIFLALKKCLAQNISVIVCGERPCNSSLEKEFKVACGELNLLLEQIEKHSWHDFFMNTNNKLNPYFDESKRERLIKKLEGIVGPNNSTELSHRLVLCNTSQTKKSLFDYLLKNHITYIPIDIINKNQLTEKAFKLSEEEQEALILQNEKIRIITMSQNILEKAIEPLKSTGGIIFCNVGVSHVPELAKVVSTQCAYPLESTELYCYSDYNTKLGKYLENLRSVDTKACPLNPLYFLIRDNKFHTNPEFNKILENHMKNIKASQFTKAKAQFFNPTPKAPPSSYSFMYSMNSITRPFPSKSLGDYAGSRLQQLGLKRTLKYTGAAFLFGMFCFKFSKPNAREYDNSSVKQGPK